MFEFVNGALFRRDGDFHGFEGAVVLERGASVGGDDWGVKSSSGDEKDPWRCKIVLCIIAVRWCWFLCPKIEFFKRVGSKDLHIF